MDTVRALIADLYDRLLLRDVFGKIVPGGVVLAGIVYTVLGKDVFATAVTGRRVVEWVGVLGFCWTLAFALQWLGEVTRLLRNVPKGYDRPAFYERMARFSELTAPRLPHQGMHAERLLVIKETCGNSGVALLVVTIVALIVRAIRTWREDGAFWVGFKAGWDPDAFVFALTVIAGISLVFMHHQHVERHKELIDRTIRYLETPPATSTPSPCGT